MNVSLLQTKRIAKTFMIAVMAFVLMTQSTVNAQSAAMANKAAENEIKSLVAKMKTEVERRLSSTEKALKALEGSNAVPSSSKNTIADVLTKSKKALTNFKQEITGVKDLDAAKKLAKEIDDQYDQYASANATAMTLKDGDVQQQAAQQLETVADDAQSMIDTAGSSGQDVSAMQEQLKGIDQLIQSISAIIASIIALIMSLATGNFTQAMTIFQTITGQLSQNLTSIGTAQNGLTGIVESLNNIELLKAGTGGSSTTSE